MKVQLSNVGIIKDCDLEFTPGINLIIGSSGSGKSTLMRCIYNTAMNGFSDSDVAFGKSSMTVTIENNGNIIQYHRNPKAKGEKSYYVVNGETYSKIGRQPVQAVTDAFNIGDVEINGEKVNFNCNLQFATPFLILGSQSTLYNVLTYRSTFDIASINDYYNADLRTNHNEINANNKLKAQLQSNLESLQTQEKQLKPIEDIYSNYITYKHNLEKLNDIKSVQSRLECINDLSDKIVKLESLLSSINNAMKYTKSLYDMRTYNDTVNNHSKIIVMIDKSNLLIALYNNVLSDIQRLASLNKYKSLLDQSNDMMNSIQMLNNIIYSSQQYMNKESFITDITRLKLWLKNNDKCNKIINELDKCSNINMNIIDDLCIIDDKLKQMNKVNHHINDLDDKCQAVNNELHKFDVCPLCGSHLKSEQHI